VQAGRVCALLGLRQGGGAGPRFKSAAVSIAEAGAPDEPGVDPSDLCRAEPAASSWTGARVKPAVGQGPPYPRRGVWAPAHHGLAARCP